MSAPMILASADVKPFDKDGEQIQELFGATAGVTAAHSLAKITMKAGTFNHTCRFR
jgi:hypothetical protein